MLRQIPDCLRGWLPRRARSRALALFAGVAIAALAVAAFWLVRIVDRADHLAAAVRGSGSEAETAMTAADPELVRQARVRLAAHRDAVESLGRDLWPLRVAGAVIGRVPVLGDNVTAAPQLTERLSSDLDAALALTEAGGALLDLYASMPGQTAGLVSMLDALPDDSAVEAAAPALAAADQALAVSEARAADVRDGRLWGRLGREARELREQEGRLRELIDWAALAADSMRALAGLADTTEPLRGLLDGGGGLTEEALDQMTEVEAAAGAASRAVTAASEKTPASVAGSDIGRKLRDFEPVLAALHDTARAGALTAGVVFPALAEMEGSRAGLFGAGTKLLDSMERLAEGRADLVEAETLALDASERLRTASITTPAAAAAGEALGSLSTRFAKAVSFLRDLPEIAPAALGRDGERRYLVVGETADELRATGGLVTGVWLLTFDGGQMTGAVYHDVVEFDDTGNLEAYPAPPGLLARYMDAPVWLLRDVGWEPDFPVVARTAAELWRLGPGDGESLDGVIALTQWGIIRLAQALGSVTTDQGRVPSGELLANLEAGTDRDGRLFLDTVFRGMLAQFNGPEVNGRLLQLAQAAADTLRGKQALAHLFDPELQQAVARAGWDGTISVQEGDRLAVIDSNIGWSKVDRNIRRQLGYEVSLRRGEAPRAVVKVSYENMSGPGSPGCGIQRNDGRASYAELKQACYWDLLRVYGADDARLTGASALPLPAGSVYARLGLGVPGDDTVEVGVGPGGKFISGLLMVPPGESREATFELSPPASVMSWNGDSATYSLTLNAQPGVQGRDTAVTVQLPAGYEYAGSSLSPARVEGREVVFDFVLDEDTTLHLEMRTAPAPGDDGTAGAAAEGPGAAAAVGTR